MGPSHLRSRHGGRIEESRDNAHQSAMPLEALALSMRPQTLFESWDCTPPALPPRSRLYGLDPVGIGTPFVESLSGYVARLADAHAVSVGDMVGRELVAFASKPLISFGRFMKQNRATSHGFHAQAQAINGLGESSRTWTEALEIGRAHV